MQFSIITQYKLKANYALQMLDTDTIGEYVTEIEKEKEVEAEKKKQKKWSSDNNNFFKMFRIN